MDALKKDLLTYVNSDQTRRRDADGIQAWMLLYERVCKAVQLSSGLNTDAECSRVEQITNAILSWREEVPEDKRDRFDRLTAYAARMQERFE